MGRKKSADELKQISKREMNVIKLIAEDLINKEIGARLGIVEDTVKTHKRHIRTKLGVKGDVGIYKWYLNQAPTFSPIISAVEMLSL